MLFLMILFGLIGLASGGPVGLLVERVWAGGWHASWGAA